MMRLNYKLPLVFSLLFLFSCSASHIIRKNTYDLESAEIQGIKHYKKGNYQAAFNFLKEPAAWGYKGSQYAIAFMFLKGQYVKQSTVLGMGWLGVAKESKVKEWEEQFDSFYLAAPGELRLKIDAMVAEYIRRYGMKAQDVTCRKTINASSRRVDVKCHKYSGLGTLYEVDLTE